MSRASIGRAWKLLPRWFRRTLVLTGGLVLFAIGAVFTVLPGPGIPFLIASLSLLAIEFAWADHYLTRLRHHSTKLAGAVKNRVRRAPVATAEAGTVHGTADRKPGDDLLGGDAVDGAEPRDVSTCATHTEELDLDGRTWCPNCRRFAEEPRRLDPTWWESQTGFEE